MNFVYISPQFPKTNWNFCDRLKQNGVTVLGIADVSYDELDEKLKNSLTEYYKVSSLENYDEVLRAVGYFTFKYGKIDWLESNNEYWLEQDSKLRTDFNINSGIKSDEILNIKEKSLMKNSYKKAEIGTAAYHIVSTLKEGKKFIEKVGFPVVVKPDNGVGASNTYRIKNEKELKKFYENLPDMKYIMEEYVSGDLVSYDAIIDAEGNPIFESGITWEPTIMDIVNEGLDLYYYVRKELPKKLIDAGRRTVKGFGVKSRFIHMEFFKLLEDKKGLGKKGDYIGLEVNMRPAGGYTPDMYNYANNTDVYQIWADMIAFGKIVNVPANSELEKYYCVYVSRRDSKNYIHTHEEIIEKYNSNLVMYERMPELYSAAMGNNMYTAKFLSKEKMEEFVDFVHKIQ
ncbi:ATP-grasp domain-containing protein [Leptotrichia sp. OH3620_COT-345]|uniref:ATP-grasp domain-containing protein n=1 Tax=Leptotrichia sp. OH3620_COT-345 TaxID=2491048 RepID=UPI000F6483D6|nr:ATP-grasp domain-containing protein [Leptotrichia sp. OH3620_COT-345]RRD40901.1 ATP-grasp domain-containing protein [Leptotrichia sp. OH3620_COT-345]